MEQKMNGDERLLSRLVQEELSRADRLSPGDALEGRLRARIAAERVDRRGLRHRSLRFASVAAAGLALILGFVLLRHALFAPGGALALSSCMARQMLDTSGDLPELGPDNPYAQAWRQLKGPGRDASSYESLFMTGAQAAQGRGTAPVVPPERGHRKLGLEGTVRILFFERSLEKCLIENAKKNGEV